MDELDTLICQQTSYSRLVEWIQEQQGCNYLTACTRLNEALKQYRLRHQLNPG
jgi:hypothetical protein